MTSKIYVGNLPYTVTNQDLRRNFSDFGEVKSAKVMMDRDSGQSKGFGFVEMASAEEAQAAIAALNGMAVEGRAITVSPAKAKEERGDSNAIGPAGYRASHRKDVGYGTGGFGGGRY